MYKEPINTYKKTTFFHLFQINPFAAVIFFLKHKLAYWKKCSKKHYIVSVSHLYVQDRLSHTLLIGRTLLQYICFVMGPTIWT